MGGSGGVPHACAGAGDATASLWLAESWWKSPPKADCMNIYEGGYGKLQRSSPRSVSLACLARMLDNAV